MEENKIVVIDDENVEHEMTILFTFEDEASKRKFVAYYDPNDEEGNVFASIYDEENNLFPIVDEKDWAMVEEVLESYMEESEKHEDDEECECDDEECGCGCEHEHNHEDNKDCECEHDHEHECECGKDGCTCQDDEKAPATEDLKK